MKKILCFLTLIVILGSCKKNLTDLNVNPKAAQIVPGETLFSNAEKNFADILTTPNVNSGVFELYVQYWAETTYPQESNYELGERNIPQNWWTALYRDVIKDLDQSKKLIASALATNSKVQQNKLAIAEILEVHAWSVLVNTFGDIPYTEALDFNNTTPKYDNQKDVFYALTDSLDAAINKLDASAGSFGSADIIYGGVVSKWIKYGNSLKLRLGLLLADVDPAKAKKMVEAAAPNVFTSNADNALFKYLLTPPNVNPIWSNLVQSGRNDFVAANTIIDSMNVRNDPRRSSYFTTGPNGTSFVGGAYGQGNTFENFSQPSAKIEAADFPAILMDYAEVEFNLAEAVERGFNVGGTAQEHYNNAVTASIIFWGGSAADAAAYLAQPNVNYATAAADWKQKIGVQAWIALYTRGFDAWTEWRKLDYPKLQAPPSARSALPLRFTYPQGEQNLNQANYEAASVSIGGDKVTTKLFWDKF